MPDTDLPFDHATLVRALVGYLHDVDEDFRACLRHDPTTAVYATHQDISLVRLFPASDVTIASVREGTERLPSWRQSPFWGVVRARWEAVDRQDAARGSTNNRPSLAVSRGVSWAGRPVHVSARPVAEGTLLRVELLLPHVPREVPELPLRQVAHGLLCHAYVLPGRVAEPFPLRSHPQPGSEGVLQFLRRTMPENTYASHCIFKAAEGD